MSKEIEISELTKEYSNSTTAALKQLSVAFESGKISSILGPNGSGKTTFLKIILGLLRPSQGEVRIFQERVLMPYPVSIKRNFLFLPDEPIVIDYLTGAENLEYMCAVYNIDTKNLDIDSILEKYGLADSRGKLVRDYSKGMKQRLQLSYIDVYAPKIIVLDEPTNGLDILAIASISEILKTAAGNGALVLVATHDMSFCRNISDDILLLQDGQKLCWQSTAQYLQDYGTLENAVMSLLHTNLCAAHQGT